MPARLWPRVGSFVLALMVSPHGLAQEGVNIFFTATFAEGGKTRTTTGRIVCTKEVTYAESRGSGSLSAELFTAGHSIVVSQLGLQVARATIDDTPKFGAFGSVPLIPFPLFGTDLFSGTNMVLRESVASGAPHMLPAGWTGSRERPQTVTLQSQGKILETWTLSDYVKTPFGWVPRTQIRRAGPLTGTFAVKAEPLATVPPTTEDILPDQAIVRDLTSHPAQEVKFQKGKGSLQDQFAKEKAPSPELYVTPAFFTPVMGIFGLAAAGLGWAVVKRARGPAR